MQLPVNEIFDTIQGEAAFTGTPAVFVRLQGCPVGCGWCDTKHTWHLTDPHKADQATVLAKTAEPDVRWSLFTTAEIVDQVRVSGIRHVVITGGEPCLYDLRDLTMTLLADERSVQVETSCTMPISVAPRTWVTGSPKIGMAGGYNVILQALRRADEIKFPVGKQSDIDKLEHQILPHTRPGAKVWLQPLSQSQKATALCIDTAKRRNWNVSVQTHKYIGVR